jgi:uncharacterized protein YdeI (YjbR/CyaY-like superfamily)
MNQAPTTVAFRATIELGGKTAAGIEVPDDAVAALGHGKAGRRFKALSCSHRRRFVLFVEDAKTPATRRRPIAKAVETLRATPA